MAIVEPARAGQSVPTSVAIDRPAHRFKRVLILSAGVGAGHVRAGEALARAFNFKDAAEDVRHLDILEHSTGLLRAAYARGYSYMARHMPSVTSSLYDALDRPERRDRRPRLFDRLNSRQCLRRIREYQPDIAICTHFLAATMVSSLITNGQVRAKLAVVVTDLDVHALWLGGANAYYFVAIDQARAYLEEVGIAPARIFVCGIPIDPDFATPVNRSELRAKHGLTDDRWTILVSAARLSADALQQIVRSLSGLRQPAHVLVLCGQNDAAKRRVEAMTAPGGAADASVCFRAFGRIEGINELMAVSDILVGRPGGLTISEALASGLVLVIVNPTPGQEERNADHLLEQGVALRCNDLPVLGYKIDRLLESSTRFEAMRANAARLGRPRAAFDIVDALARLGCATEAGW